MSVRSRVYVGGVYVTHKRAKPVMLRTKPEMTGKMGIIIKEITY